LQVLERLGDTELLEAYEKFVTRLEGVLTPQEQEVYTLFQQRTMGGSVPPEEQAVADKVADHAELPQLYERFLTILSSRHAS
jgi:hypothetical protein